MSDIHSNWEQGYLEGLETSFLNLPDHINPQIPVCPANISGCARCAFEQGKDLGKKVVKLREVICIAKEFCIQYSLYISFLEHYDETCLATIKITNNFFDVALINWAKLFGSTSERLHYKNVLSNFDEFKKQLFSELNINGSKWRSYWDSLKGYRDKHVAHCDREAPEVDVPDLELAFDSVCFYHDYAKQTLKRLNLPVYCKSELRKVFEQDIEYDNLYAEAVIRASSKLASKC